MENIYLIMFALIRSAIENTFITDEEKKLVTDDIMPYLLKLSQKHDVTHLIAEGLSKNSLLKNQNESCSELQTSLLAAVYRYGLINYTLTNLCNIFENEGIDFLPLKGAVMRSMYREPWMRTSCDIDVFVNEFDLNRTVSLLIDKHGFKKEAVGSHDVSMFAPNGVHLELHYNLIEDGLANNSSHVLENIWQKSKPKEGHNHWFEMNDEMFYFYHISHMAKHFENGGCGIRPFIDLWILNKTENHRREELLQMGGLLKFANAVCALSNIWFGNSYMDNISEQIQNYIIDGGVYGNANNRISLQQQKKGGKFEYAVSKIFVPYDIIKFHYPILQKYRFLTPVMEVRRWGKLIFCGGAKRSFDELVINKNVSNSEAEKMKEFLDSIGL